VARELWLLRHGDAEPGDGQPDEDRRLTERGERQATAAGAALAAIGAEFALVLTSPRVRALQTAQLACRHLGLEPVEHSPLSGGFGREEALALLESQAADARVLVVGHEPDFSQTVHDLTGGRIDLKKGGLAAVAVEAGEAELLVLMRPRELLAAGEAGGGGI
jgi:phosphohistidine phosphatase